MVRVGESEGPSWAGRQQQQHQQHQRQQHSQHRYRQLPHRDYDAFDAATPPPYQHAHDDHRHHDHPHPRFSPHHQPSRPPSSPRRPIGHSRPPFDELRAPRHVAMKRDQSSHGDDHDVRDRPRSDREPPRAPAGGSHRARSRSLSPYSRRAQAFRERGYARDELPPPPPDDRYDRHRDDYRARYRSPDRGRGDEDFPASKRAKKRSRRDRSRQRDRRRPKKPGQHYPPEPEDFDRHPSRDRSRSPPLPPSEPDLERGRPSSSGAHRLPPLHPRDRSLSPRPGSPRSSFSRNLSPLPHRTHPEASEGSSYSRRPSPGLERSRHSVDDRDYGAIPTGPAASRKKTKRRDERLAKWGGGGTGGGVVGVGFGGPPSSGANSVEVSMSRRSDHRGSHLSSAFPSRHASDTRNNQSPPHLGSGSSHQGSPVSHTSNTGQRHFSPTTQHPPPPPKDSDVDQRQVSPHPPSGLSQGRGFSRGGFRGSSFNSTRGGTRGESSSANGNFQTAPFNPPTGPAATRRLVSHSGNSTPQHAGSHYEDSVHSEAARDQRDAADEGGNALDRRQDMLGEHSPQSIRDNDDEQQQQQQQPPPSSPSQVHMAGPAAAAPPSGLKFSFAFNKTSKTPVAAPKPEISQKFSAAPPRKDPLAADDRSQRERDRDRERERERDRDREREREREHERDRTRERERLRERDRERERERERDRDLPRGTPTEPASSRARGEVHRGRQPPPPPPPQPQHHPHEPRRLREPLPPKTRKVTKTLRRAKARPALSPPEHANSESVYFRKPGNESVVGSGTYGKVFKGTNVYSKRLVALKKIRMEGERDGFPVTAIREIKLLQSLKHQNIVNLIEVMVEANNCYMVFEYLSHDLTGLLNHPSYKLDPAQRKHLAQQLFEGLDYLHGRGVLHRDIKAANILVSSDGILKLADFGLARFYSKHHRLDYTNRVITIWYRSPELLLGETQYTAAVDVWSAACVMVEIFTRHAIFPGDGTEINQLDKIYAVLGTPNKVEWPDLVKMEWFQLLRPTYRKSNVFADKYKERLPAAAFDLLASMFRYDPAKRPTAAEVLQHPYFTTEQPPPRQAVELASIQGDWHEFESKALRRAKEKQEREARQAAKESGQREREKKRPNDGPDPREAKRPHIEGQSPVGAVVAERVGADETAKAATVD